jgi:hypothetical protein
VSLELSNGDVLELRAADLPALLLGRLYLALPEDVTGGWVRFLQQRGPGVPFTLEGEPR